MPTTTPSPVASWPSLGSVRAMIVVSIFLFFIALALFTRSNTFPYYYHPDEPLEVQLVLKNDANFHHPLLMGNTTDAVSRLLHLPRTPQSVVLAGRWCVAVFGALAIVVFAWLAFLYGGVVAGAAAGILILFDPLLIECGHYYKEDPGLLLGLALSFLAFALFWRAPSWKTSLFLGASCAVAFSGKYIGIVAAVLALALLLRVPLGWSARLRLLALFLAAFLAVTLAINYQFLTGLAGVHAGIGREVTFLGDGSNEGVSRSIPNSKYVALFLETTNPFICFFIVWRVLAMFLRRHTTTLPEWIIAAFPFALLLALSFTPKTAERYFLPGLAVAGYLAGLGVADFSAFLFRSGRSVPWKIFGCAALCLVITAWKPVVHSFELLRGFTSDGHHDLVIWIKDHVSPGAVIAEDSRVQLAPSGDKDHDDRGFTLTQPILTSYYVADLGSIPDLRRRGVAYVAIQVNEKFRPDRQPSAAVRNDFDRRKHFYYDLGQQATLVWQSTTGRPLILRPKIMLYRLNASPSTPVPTPTPVPAHS